MTFHSIRNPLLATLFAGFFWGASSVSCPALAKDNSDDLASIGLVVHWQSNVGGAPLANGSQSFVLWTHTSEKREYVTVRSGDRVIERFRGEEVDQKKLEQAIIEGKKLLTAPRLGLEGATEKAQKLVATYKTLGRKVDIEPYSQRIVYAVTLTTNGIIETMDAETGAVLWRAEAGKSTLPMFGPGVSDEYVVVTNGNVFYVYELATGNLVTSRNLAFTPTACPTVLGDKAIVPSVEGRLVAYDINKPKIAPGIIRTGKENRLGVVISANRQFFSWPTGNRLIQAKMDKGTSQTKMENVPILWNAVGLNEAIHSLPVATQNGFVASTELGTVFHCSTGRQDNLFWKSRLAVQVSQSPLANKDLAFVVSDEGNLFALRMQDGTDAWGHQPSNVKNMVAIGKEHIYVKDSRNALVAIHLATGLESGRTNFILPDVIPNKVSDRLLFVTKQGQVTCLREIDATVPTFATEMSSDSSATPVSPSKSEEPPVKSMEEDSNVFDGAGSTSSDEDPFKMDP